MRVLAFSDLHRDLDQAARLVEWSADADLVIGAGDFASIHEGLGEAIAALAEIEAPTLLVPGNNETDEALREAARSWPAASVLHGEGAEVGEFFGLGAGVPITPWDWSFDLSEDEAAGLLAGCPPEAVLIVHSPPRGRGPLGLGRAPGQHRDPGGDRVEAPAARRVRPHPRELGRRGPARPDAVVNLGPSGTWFEL